MRKALLWTVAVAVIILAQARVYAQSLAGDWQGEYQGKESGRSGTVSFSLAIGRHIAEGEVVMSGSTPLKIEFVQIKGGQDFYGADGGLL